jgi:hypothetical protein
VGVLGLVLVAAVFVLAACGDNQETTTTEGVTTSLGGTTSSLGTETTVGSLSNQVVVQLTGDQEVPPVDTNATGTFTVELATGATGSTSTSLGMTPGSETSTTSSGSATNTTALGGVTTTSVLGGTATTSSGTSGSLSGVGLRWKLDVQNMSNVTAAHIHVGQAGENGPVLIPLFNGPTKEGSFSGTLAEGTLTLSDLPQIESLTPAQVLNLFQTGGAYVNVHTTDNPNGEIRGQLNLSTLMGGGAAGGGATGTTQFGSGTTDGMTGTTQSMGLTTTTGY